MFDVQLIRKTLVWGIPLYLGLMVGSLLMVTYIIVPAIVGIAHRVPVVRIAPTAQVAPFIAIFCLLGLVVSSMRAVPCSDALIKPFERAFIASIVAGGLSMLLIPVTAAVVRFNMPSLGYSICGDLQGHPTLWFTDWVRDPAWCVKDKSLEWVFEQAAIKN
ncbi:hypothetical protein SAMN05192589_107122 [Paracidovorax valerianellae]|uniref:Uncharacterized protein n=1 Tax=Paracidovorax valerianellae TaxID=187868 RepID=A0A1G6VTT2_9BURK|nr:hypothetical protein [Paracidovorax valerianellae]SDD56397.1 hypothetical protein SAMN05192589_107122 [Paracidovorax valerianellae]